MVPRVSPTLRSLLLVSAGAAIATLIRKWHGLFKRLLHGPPAMRVPLAFSTCRVHRICSRAGLRYKLNVSLPHGYEDSSSAQKRYPVIVALDSEPYLFPLLTVLARTNHFFARSYYFPDVIVVGIVADLESESRFHSGGQLDVRRFWSEQRPTRARDYLPTRAESPWGGPGAPSVLEVSGHAFEFVDFLADTLLPFIEATYRTRGAEARALIGKSFGGCGVAAAMIHESGPVNFSEFVLGSPSIAWDDEAWFRLEKEARAAAMSRPDAHTTGSPPYSSGVFCCIGAERDVDQDMIRRFQRVLDDRSGPRGEVTVEVLAGETHGSVTYPFVHHALEWLTKRWAVFDAADGDAKATRLLEDVD